MKKVIFTLLLLHFVLFISAGLRGRYYTSIGWFDVDKTHVRFTKEGCEPGKRSPYKISLNRGDTCIILFNGERCIDTMCYYKDKLYPMCGGEPYSKKLWYE
jgi:hypothetical protein